MLHTTKRSADDHGVAVIGEGTTELAGLTVRRIPDGAGFVLELRNNT